MDRVFIKQGKTMRFILAIMLPFLSFFTIGKPIQGVICLILQITFIGWIPAAIWAIYSLSGWPTDKKNQSHTAKNRLSHSQHIMYARICS
jgi:uncharacterized membrane protein YqaE (UPF0057 family)